MNKQKVVVFEDDADILFTLEPALQIAGFEVETIDTLPLTAADPLIQDLIAEILAGRVAAVVFDVHMPSIGIGPTVTFTFSREVRDKTQEQFPDLPLIANSNKVANRKIQIEEAGCNYEGPMCGGEIKNSLALAQMIKEILNGGCNHLAEIQAMAQIA